MKDAFLGIERVSLGPWQAFDRAIERFLIHGGWENVRLVDGSGDLGADLVADASGRCWIFQCKFRSGSAAFGPEPVDEALRARQLYRADVAIVAVSGRFNMTALEVADRARVTLGVDVRLWDAETLVELGRKLPERAARRPELRPYQASAVDAIWNRHLSGDDRALLLLATGLGKTRVAAEIVERWLGSYPADEVLLIAHSLDLVAQLERALWRYLPKHVHTHQLHGGEKPTYPGGVTVATFQSLGSSDLEAQHTGRYGLVVVDEAHHAPADAYARLIATIEPRFLLGMTATPWRGDQRQVSEIFGEPAFSMSIIEGMQQGFLAEVDYRMLMDNVDWRALEQLTEHQVSIRDLNRRLFVPERDEAIAETIREHIDALEDPRVIVFTRSIEHAERFAGLLQAEGLSAVTVHSRKGRVDITGALHGFSVSSPAILVTVDMLNEGIDLPDVNMVVFLRVTHSRRIFVQQLGRGLRITSSKKKVLVLDFVADVRRIAAGLSLNREAAALSRTKGDAVVVNVEHPVSFSGNARLRLFEHYLKDVAELEDMPDEGVVHFPPTYCEDE